VDLADLLDELADVTDPSVLVGIETSDDAGVIALNDDLALVQTADVITPVTDDAYAFGQVAAANSLSDVYAMGGKPVGALNLAFFPDQGVPVEALKGILRGAHDKVREAGALVIGGHTVRDDEVKFGLAVTGTCHPDQVLRNSGARPGDLLVLTKPLGTAVLIGGHKRGWIEDAVFDEVLRWMMALNDIACEEALAYGAHGATDVTGFGLAGHSREMVVASDVRFRFWFNRIPHYPEALEMIARGLSTVVTPQNRESVKDLLEFVGDFDEPRQTLMFDPQTSGGLLVSLPADEAHAYVEALRTRGVDWSAVVGEVLPASPGSAAIEVREHD
jgi:selenide,water dikinase